MNTLIEQNSFGKKESFAIKVKTYLSKDKKYLFAKMCFYLSNRKICNVDNNIFVLQYALSYIKDFLSKYESNKIYHKELSSYLDEDNIEFSFSNLIKKQQKELIDNLDVSNKLYRELDESFLGFEWEPLQGYSLHYIETSSKSLIFWDENKDFNFNICELEKGEFYSVLKDFYKWACQVIDNIDSKDNI